MASAPVGAYIIAEAINLGDENEQKTINKSN